MICLKWNNKIISSLVKSSKIPFFRHIHEIRSRSPQNQSHRQKKEDANIERLVSFICSYNSYTYVTMLNQLLQSYSVTRKIPFLFKIFIRTATSNVSRFHLFALLLLLFHLIITTYIFLITKITKLRKSFRSIFNKKKYEQQIHLSDPWFFFQKLQWSLSPGALTQDFVEVQSYRVLGDQTFDLNPEIVGENPHQGLGGETVLGALLVVTW